MKWGLLGGAFDPIHFGHLRSGQEVLEAMGLDRVVFIPSYMPPFKRYMNITPFEHRLRMAQLAAGGNEAFLVSDIEQREKLSFTIDTVRKLREENGKDLELYFILGQDAFRDIAGWKDWRELLGSCNFVVTTRPGSDCGDPGAALPVEAALLYKYDAGPDSFQGPSGSRLYFRKISFLEISSTDIRDRLRRGLSARYLLPDAVIEYIRQNGIYS